MTNSRLLPKIGLAAFSALAMLGVCELAARAVFPPPPDGARQPDIVYRYDPEIRYVHVPNQKGWIDDGFVTINSFGFRGREVVVPKPSGRVRVVVLGDSVTLGWGVGDEETYSFHLEQLLRKRFPDRDFDVVNMAVAGYNTRQEVTLLERHVTRLAPDLVLVGFYTNDVSDAAGDKGPAAAAGTRILAANPQDGQVLHLNPTPSSWLDRQLRRSRFIYMVGHTARQIIGKGEARKAGFPMELDVLQGKESPELDRAWETVQKQFGDLQRLAMADGFSVGVVVLPCKEQVLGQYRNAHYQDRVRAMAQSLGFFVVDPLSALAAANAPADALFIPYDRNHPSAAGHRIIGETIFHYLEDRGLLPATGRVVAPSHT